jgi:DNA helicase-2/ATP-dependent DNA helicase PcrA
MTGFQVSTRSAYQDRRVQSNGIKAGTVDPPKTDPRKRMIRMHDAQRKPSLSESFESDDPQKIQVGMDVEHPRFGKGKVVNMDGKYPDTKATVFFQQAGQKQLLLKFAKLKIVGSD